MRKIPTKEEAMQRLKNFVTLRNKVSLVLSIVILIAYYVFVLGVGLFPEVLAFSIGPSSISLGIIYGISIIVLSILATGLYTFFANKHFDKVQSEVIEDLQDSGALDDLKKKGVL
ncbi:DUF485 domain-containing protein [uncultured Campylobacter sp.]|uniref:DUF485 domain-containing protein n=1 Tax=uncultured Campylobacter sp. TaxID=218934 RepID=UPI0026137E77|nr:DUF485 domain-containing protein [uncultured Campylobacter sp.]